MSYDILGIGCAAVDDLIFVDVYPPADVKVYVRKRARACGGLTATALVAASRLGAKCAYAGVLGDNELSRFVEETFRREGVQTGTVLRKPKCAPINSTIIVDMSNGHRTIYVDLAGGYAGKPEPGLAKAATRAKVLFIDHVEAPRALVAARAARKAGIPIVADMENDAAPEFRELMKLVDHAVVSLEFAQKITGQIDPKAIAAALWMPGRQAVVITCGADGAWYQDSAAEPAKHQQAFRVKVVDTTGCGDVFHGAYAAALVHGLDLRARVRFAAAAAALKATRPGGQAGIPDRKTVEKFL